MIEVTTGYFHIEWLHAVSFRRGLDTSLRFRSFPEHPGTVVARGNHRFTEMLGRIHPHLPIAPPESAIAVRHALRIPPEIAQMHLHDRAQADLSLAPAG